MCIHNGVQYRDHDDAEIVHLHARTLLGALVALGAMLAAHWAGFL